MSGESHPSDASQPCGNIDVLLTGTSAKLETLLPLLRQYGHPVRAAVSAPQADEPKPTVVVLFCHDANDCCTRADEVHNMWPAASVIIVTAHLSNELEEQAAVRPFARLRKATPNSEELHALIHDAVKPPPDTTPTALKPRTTDHPPSSR